MLGSKLDYIQIRHRNPESLTLIKVRAKLLAGMLFLLWNIAWRVKSRSQTIFTLHFLEIKFLKRSQWYAIIKALVPFIRMIIVFLITKISGLTGG